MLVLGGKKNVPETNIAPLKIKNGWKMNFLLGWPIFKSYLGGCKYLLFSSLVGEDSIFTNIFQMG